MQTGLPLRDTPDQLLKLLIHGLTTRHQGRMHGINASSLAAQIGVTERSLRKLISDAREQGVAVVGAPETGYYVAETAAELEECCHFLRSRALHSLMLEARMRKITLPVLLGQLNLNT
ncbi:MAG: HTH domain-containing protein [Collimonas sp.]|uniref:HTH domain-containing protein n=1 Tax=Collimonas sp. TaxID=1963772 RepID=UPI00326459E1